MKLPARGKGILNVGVVEIGTLADCCKLYQSELVHRPIRFHAVQRPFEHVAGVDRCMRTMIA